LALEESLGGLLLLEGRGQLGHVLELNHVRLSLDQYLKDLLLLAKVKSFFFDGTFI